MPYAARLIRFLFSLNCWIAFLMLVSVERTNGQSVVWENEIHLQSDGRNYVERIAIISDYLNTWVTVPKGVSPEEYFLEIKPSEYTFYEVPFDKENRVYFSQGNYEIVADHRFDEQVTIDKYGQYTYRTDTSLTQTGHYGFYWDADGVNISKFTFVWTLPEEFEFVSYQVNRHGRWVTQPNVIMFQATDTNDLVFEIKYRRRDAI